MSGLKQPDSFLDKPGPITMPWKTWVAQFENYLVASGGTNYPVARKKALLLHCLGLLSCVGKTGSSVTLTM